MQAWWISPPGPACYAPPVCALSQLNNAVERIVLTGFMGSGKTTVGRMLAAQLGWRFVDLDDAVETRELRSVPEIFAQHGEVYFRQAEKEVLAGLLRQREHVIALGGGAPGTEAVASLLRSAPGTSVIYLQAPFDLLYARCTAQALLPQSTARPLLGDRGETERRHEARRVGYAAVAHRTVNGANAPDAVTGDILQILGLTEI